MIYWDFLKKYSIDVYCICLIDRNDKFIKVSDEFDKVGLLPMVKFHRPVKNKNTGLGCFLSHKFCMQNSNNNVLVFEDDVKFTNDWQEKLLHIKAFLENEPNYNILRLGCFLTSIHESPDNTDKVCLSKSYMTHALIYSTEYKNKLLKNPTFDGQIQIDDYLHDESCKDFALVNPICYQRIINNTSDNVWQSTRVQLIMQRPYIYENIQWLANIYISGIRCLPVHIQEKVNLWYLMYKIFR